MRSLLAMLLFATLAACGGQEPSPSPSTQPGTAQAAPAALGAPGARNNLPDGGWFTWNFSEKPKLGTLIIKVSAFNNEGALVQVYDISGEYGMPSMPYHDSGPVKFQLNKKGYYLLPVDVVMPGEWSVTIRVKQGTKEHYAGKVLFTV